VKGGSRNPDSPGGAAPEPVSEDEFGAHVSAAGGVEHTPERANDIGSVVLQLFTKQPNRWVEPELSADRIAAFRTERERRGIRVAASHDSYLINLASPDPSLWQKSLDSFRREYRRCVELGLELLVTHPGNATDGDGESGIARNAEAVTRVLEEVEGDTRVLLEITAGSGTSIGGSLEGLSEILARIPEAQTRRVGVCFDTCHAYSAGYDLVGDFDGVWDRFSDRIGLDRLGLFHLNDSKHPLGSRKDRHEHIGEGSLGDDPFRRIVTDPRFDAVPKILETPKGDDLVTLDRRNLARLRAFRTPE